MLSHIGLFNTFLSAAGQFWLQQLHLVLISVCIRTTLTHTQRLGTLFLFEAVIGRHRLFAVDVCGTVWELDNPQEMTGQTADYRESNSGTFTPSGKC